MTEFTADGIDRTTTLKVSGLTCGHCVAHVTEELEALNGVKNVSVLLNKGGQSTVTVLSDVRLEDAALAEADWVIGGDPRQPLVRLTRRDETVRLESALPGDFNRVNTAMAAVALIEAGNPADRAGRVISRARCPRQRPG